jgi:four helix bundle protein
MPMTFRDMDVYRRATGFADEMHEVVVRWPKFELWSVGIQLVRAADSVGANIAEALGRWHQPDRKRLLYIARGSLSETEHWVLRAEERGPPNGLIKKSRPG